MEQRAIRIALPLLLGYNPHTRYVIHTVEPMTPQVFAGKYVVQEEIARGGMGVIYKALDRTLNRTVAIKLVHAHFSGDASFAERFLREARAMGRLQHKNIVTIYAVEEERNTQFLVMEFCPGTNLRDLIRTQSTLPLRDAVSLAEQLASALAYAHTRGVIHRDIKPANALVNQQGTAKLTDFGIAAALDEAALTSAGQIIGTPEYMSPEQARGWKLDGRSDLYSLGIVLYEMLTGKTPYPESSGTAILGKLAHDREELSLSFPSHVPSLVQGVVRDLLRRNPDDRIADADILASQLHELLYTLPETPEAMVPDTSEPTEILPSPMSHTRGPTRPIVRDMESPIAPGRPQTPPEYRFTPSATESRPSVADHTIPLPRRDRTGPRPSRSESITPPLPPEIVAPPPTRPLGVIVAVGIVLIGLTAIGIISYFPSQLESTSSGDKSIDLPPRQIDTEPQPPAPLPNPTAKVEIEPPQPILPPQPMSPSEKNESLTPSVQAVTTFPDATLQSLLDRFQQAYERQDLAELRSISRMDQARQRYVEEMFRTYKTLKLSRPTLTREENGAAAVLLIELAITTTGETVDLTPIARKITLHIPRQGDAWDKIVW
ncbi:MAG: protein kinase [Nitrospira sp.]|nr:protein kinase [Nitrospira sp.]MDH4243261.1 protein kinase [Nitrospira sp.]MDH4358089.1 protein kinase [Nitrospira sp.]MDH5317394.1 protein kinase [Nitrospira sp.]